MSRILDIMSYSVSNTIHKNILNFCPGGVYNNYMSYPNREKICMMCPFLKIDTCTKNDLQIKDFINLRLATCPVYKW